MEREYLVESEDRPAEAVVATVELEETEVLRLEAPEGLVELVELQLQAMVARVALQMAVAEAMLQTLAAMGAMVVLL